jgi:predicted transposase/invertase (TIGR01784 family)
MIKINAPNPGRYIDLLSSLKYKWDNQNVLDYAVSVAEAKGRHQEAIKIARELKKEGLPLTFIAKATNLPVEEIEKL